MDINLERPLPFADNSIDRIFAEHTIEHVSIQSAYSFFEECHRILVPGGAVRITVPSVVNVFNKKTPAYINFLKAHGWGDGSESSALKAIIFQHGHQTMWTIESLLVCLTNVGFRAREAELYKSEIPEFNNVEGHQKVIGPAFNLIESITCEGIKK